MKLVGKSMSNRKILVFSRHGKALQREDGSSIDSLVPETVTDLYTRVGCPLQAFVTEQGITAERTYLHHSPAVRTRYTEEAILIGAFNLEPRSGENPPQSIDDLSNYNFRNDTYRDPRLFFGKPYINMQFITQIMRCVLEIWITGLAIQMQQSMMVLQSSHIDQ